MWFAPPTDSSLAVSAIVGCCLFFSVLLTRVSDSGTRRSCRDSSRWRLSTGCGTAVGAMGENLVRTNPALLVKWDNYARCAVLGRHGRVRAADSEPLASGNARHLLRGFPFVRCRSPGLLRLPIGWHAAGGWIHFVLPGSRRISPGSRPWTTCSPRGPVPDSVGVVSHLLRIRSSETPEPRSGMAPIYSDG